MKKSTFAALVVAVTLVLACAYASMIYDAQAEPAAVPIGNGSPALAQGQACDGETSEAIDLAIARLDQEARDAEASFDSRAAAINAQKSEALKDLTAEVNRLNAERLKVQGKVAEQSAIDAQLKAVQQKIDAVSEPLDQRLKEIAQAKAEAKQRFEQQRADLVRQREQATTGCPPQTAPAQ